MKNIELVLYLKKIKIKDIFDFSLNELKTGFK